MVPEREKELVLHSDALHPLVNKRLVHSVSSAHYDLVSDFHSPAEGGGAWAPDEEYTDWQWWLAGTEDGDWVLVTWGY